MILPILVQEKEQNNRFSKWSPWRPPWISVRKDFYLLYFDLQITRMVPTESISLSVQEKKRKIEFQDGRDCGHIGFPIGTILPIFDLQVIPMLPTKFRVNWPFGSGEEAKNRFSTWSPRLWRPFWIFDRNDFSYF